MHALVSFYFIFFIGNFIELFSADVPNAALPTDHYQEASHYQDLKNEHYGQFEWAGTSEWVFEGAEDSTNQSFDTEPTTIPPETGTTITMDTTTSGPTTTTVH